MSETDVLVRFFSLAVLIVGSLLVILSRIPARTITQLKDLTAAYEARLRLLEDQALENSKQIAELQGQVKVYKEVPLQDIAAAMAGITASNREILVILKQSLQLAKDVGEGLNGYSATARDEADEHKK